jgi:hypothetical protein
VIRGKITYAMDNGFFQFICEKSGLARFSLGRACCLTLLSCHRFCAYSDFFLLAALRFPLLGLRFSSAILSVLCGEGLSVLTWPTANCHLLLCGAALYT